MTMDSRLARGGHDAARDSGDLHRLDDRVVRIKRVAKVVKGGRRFGFNAIVVVGDRRGHVGVGIGRANEVVAAIRKGQERARRSLIEIPLTEDGSIPHYVEESYRASKVVLRPARPGTGVIAGGAVRAVLELAGVRNLLTKIIGSTNAVNVVRATVNGLASLQIPEETVARRRQAVGASSDD
ncbi:MAG: 30S ribosomal protein S5 [Chloroflexota bacterium]|nr:30S ribosomal protein S5 [Rhodospirillaceae bacterium]MDE2766898.1 30S ribosomal protein S5 [Chloroflexota bacterium]